MKKMPLGPKILLFFILVLIFTLFSSPFSKYPVLAQSCPAGTSPRANGLVAAPVSITNSKFGTTSGACVINSLASRPLTDIDTYTGLLGQYYTNNPNTSIVKHDIVATTN